MQLEAVCDLAVKGFNMFPLSRNAKVPVKDFAWRKESSSDYEVILDWVDKYPDCNFALDMKGYVAIDVDVKEGKNGEESLKLIKDLMPETFTQTTYSGGKHYIYKLKPGQSLTQGASVLGADSHVDLRTEGGYVVASGSVIDGKAYTDNGKEIAEFPDELFEYFKNFKKVPKKKEKKTNIKVNQENAIASAEIYLDKLEPVSSGARNSEGYKVACHLKDLGLTEENAIDTMLMYWKCEPMLELSELEHVVRSSREYGQEGVGSKSAEAAFGEAGEKGTESFLEEMNREYALVYMEGSHYILHETVDPKGKPKTVFMSEPTFKRRFSPYYVAVADGRTKTHANLWLDWKERREFAGVCFAPEKKAQFGYYNLWRGFSCEPLAPEEASKDQIKGVDMWKKHTLENVCGGDIKLYNWVVGYFAHMIQKPFERPLTTLVLRGSKGVGKNAVVDRVGKLLGGHFLVAHDSRYLTSNFNGHFDSCLCLTLDEAFWSGDKPAEGKLKGLSTAPEILIERKNKEPYMVDNLVRLIIIGNEDWLVPASHDERRYAVLDVGEGAKQDGNFFHDMRVLIDDKGGDRVLLHYLKNFDLSCTNINMIPKTQGLIDQKLSSLSLVQKWWYNCLQQEELVSLPMGDHVWPEDMSVQRVQESFRVWCKNLNVKRIPDEIRIGKELFQCCPSLKKTRVYEDKTRVYKYQFPLLPEAREDWKNFIGGEVLWD